MNKAGVKEGIRKDSISHGIRSSIMAMGGYPAYFLKLRQELPTKFADMVSKYIPQEIEHINAPSVNVLNITLPEPRQAINVSEVKELEPILDAECDDGTDMFDAGRHPCYTDEEPEDGV